MTALSRGLNTENCGRQSRYGKHPEMESGKLNASELCAWRVQAALLGKTHICLHWRHASGSYHYSFPIASDPDDSLWASKHGYTLESVEFRDSL